MLKMCVYIPNKVIVAVFFSALISAIDTGKVSTTPASTTLNKTAQNKITLANEGGLSIVSPNILPSTFPSSQTSHVKGRPQAVLHNDTGDAVSTGLLKQTNNVTLDDDAITKTVNSDVNVIISNASTTKNLFNTLNSTINEPEKVKNETKHPKPTITSAQQLDELAKQLSNKPPEVAPKASAEPVVADQLSPPTGKNIHIGSTSRTPEIAIPIVITILVVPAFAVLGYMALKRGQEAWKNRHYKRMDFLLDGMYND